MTKAFCHIVLHYSIASLSWKTVKSLRRSQSRHRRHKQCSGSGDDAASLRQKNDGSDDDVVTSVDYEILMGWTIIAFHSLYVSTGIEYIVRFAVPFYYHLKMILLIATFVVPSWSVMSDGTSGLSPVVSYWFDYLIVPGVHRVHAFMGHDPKEWAKLQLAMLPLRFIDWFILPGILTTDEEKQLVRKKRSEEYNAPGDKANVDFSSIISSPEQPFDEQMISQDVSMPSIAVKVLPVEAFAQQATSSHFSPEHSYDNLVKLCDQSLLREINDYNQSAAKDSSNAANANKFDSAARAPRKHEVDKELSTTKPPVDSNHIHATPPRVLRDSTLFNEISPKQTSKSRFPRTTPHRSTEHFSPSPTPSRKPSFTNSVLSPAAKSRLESSALRLRRISQEHRLRSVLSPPKKSSRGYASLDGGDDDALSNPDVTTGEKRSRTVAGTGKSETQSSHLNTRRKRGERLSLGDHFRELVTGDANVRVRDHLFDLDLPVSPRRHLGTLRNVDTSHITTRRSSRLAKKNEQ
jgi:hypothetical protein